MKSRKLLAFFLAIFMLASLVVPASATDVNVESISTAGFSADNITVKTAPEGAIPMSSLKITVSGSTKYVTPEKNANYTITTLDELVTFATIVKNYGVSSMVRPSETEGEYDTISTWDNNGNFETCSVYLLADIDCSAETNFQPIGGWKGGNTNDNRGVFYGTFYGCGHTIRNLTIDETQKADSDVNFTYGALALFRGIRGTVQDLIIDSSCRFVGESSAAAVVGFGYMGATVQNVWNQASVTGGGLVGGIVAAQATGTASEKEFKILNCTNTGDITSTSNATGSKGVKGVGGILGSMDLLMIKSDKETSIGQLFTIDNCLNLGKISTNQDTIPVGSLVGGLYSARTTKLTIQNCVNYGDVSATKTNGICGDSAADGSLTITANTNNTDYSNTKGDMLVSFYQTSNKAYTVDGQTGDHYSLRIIATHNNIEEYKSFSYKISIAYGESQTWEKTTESQNTVYSALNVTEGETTYEVQATACGAEHFSAVSINNIPVSAGDLTVTVTYTIVQLNGTDVVKTETFTVPASTLYPVA